MLLSKEYNASKWRQVVGADLLTTCRAFDVRLKAVAASANASRLSRGVAL